MTAPSWPPDDNHPIEKWTDHELIDQYRYISAELADDDSEYVKSDDGPIAAIEEEINRRGLDVLADEIQPDPSSAGREADGPIAFPP
jgi:hypothetical protein